MGTSLEAHPVFPTPAAQHSNNEGCVHGKSSDPQPPKIDLIFNQGSAPSADRLSSAARHAPGVPPQGTWNSHCSHIHFPRCTGRDSAGRCTASCLYQAGVRVGASRTVARPGTYIQDPCSKCTYPGSLLQMYIYPGSCSKCTYIQDPCLYI